MCDEGLLQSRALALVAPDKTEYSKRILRITPTINNDNFIKRPFF